MLKPGPIDPGFFRLVSMKRILTGVMAIACGFGLIGLLIAHGGSPPPQGGLALLIFFGGGAWSLRDGLRMRRELVRSKNADADSSRRRTGDSGSDERLSGVQQ